MKYIFKVGDRVRIRRNLDIRDKNTVGLTPDMIRMKGKMVTIEKVSGTDYKVSGSTYWFSNLEFEMSKYKDKKDNMVRYMVYGTGCNNKGNLLRHESDLKIKLRVLANDEEWTGDIIGYKLTPLYQATKKTSIRVSKFKK